MTNVFSFTFKASLVRNFLLILITWIIFFPGFYSGDSFYATYMATTGELTNLGSLSWAMYVRIFSFFGAFYPFLTLLGGTLLIYGITYLAFSLFKNKNASITSFLICLTPMTFGMGITLWHDIPYTCGILLLVSFFIRLKKNEYQMTKPSFRILIFQSLLPGSILMTFRPNGLATLILFAILMITFKSNWQNLKFFVYCISWALIFTIFPSLIITQKLPYDLTLSQEWMRADISCYSAEFPERKFVERFIPEIGTTEIWASSEACSFLNKYELSPNDKKDLYHGFLELG